MWMLADIELSAGLSMHRQGVAKRSRTVAGLNRFRDLLQWSGFVLVVATLQWIGGAPGNEFGGHPDEPAHFVTGLMVREYLLGGWPQSPVQFALEYYSHYPKVSLGNWPPIFYLLQAAWTLLLPPSRIAVLLLLAVFTGTAAWLLYRALANILGWQYAAFGALLFIAFPLVQQQTGMVMAEAPVTLLAVLAALVYARYLSSERARDSALFGVIASLCILTKGTGLLLALVPVFALVLTRRFYLLRTKAFWYPVAIVAVIAGPWTWYFRDVVRDGWMNDGLTWSFTRRAIAFYPPHLITAAGAGIVAVAIVGLATRLRSPRSSPEQSIWAAFGALLLSVLVFQITVPAGLEARHLMPALPAVALFAAAGAHRLTIWCQQRGMRDPVAKVAVLCIVSAVFLMGTFQISHKVFRGYSLVAEELSRSSEDRSATVLISSDATGEGVLISEMAIRSARPDRTIWRASKLLARTDWSGDDYQLRAGNAEEVLAKLEQSNIRYLVVDGSIPARWRVAHHDVLEKAIDRHPDRFVLRREFPITRREMNPVHGVRVFEFLYGGSRVPVRSPLQGPSAWKLPGQVGSAGVSRASSAL